MGASTGRLYGLNTLAAIAGAIVTTAWLIPNLGTQGAVILLAILQGLVGGLVILFYGESRGGWARRAAATAGWAIVVALACGINYPLSLTDIYARQEPGKLLCSLKGRGRPSPCISADRLTV